MFYPCACHDVHETAAACAAAATRAGASRRSLVCFILAPVMCTKSRDFRIGASSPRWLRQLALPPRLAPALAAGMFYPCACHVHETARFRFCGQADRWLRQLALPPRLALLF